MAEQQATPVNNGMPEGAIADKSGIVTNAGQLIQNASQGLADIESAQNLYSAQQNEALNAPINQQEHEATKQYKEQSAKIAEELGKPFKAYEPKPEDYLAQGSIVAILGTLLGRGGQQSAQGAINGMTGFLKGVHEGNQQAVENSYKEYKQNMDRLKSLGENLKNGYETYLKQLATDREQAKLTLATLNATYATGVAGQKAKLGTTKDVIEAVNNTAKALSEIKDRSEKTELEKRKFDWEKTKENYDFKIGDNGKIYAINKSNPHAPAIEVAVPEGVTFPSAKAGSLAGQVQFRYNAVVTNSVDQLGIEVSNMQAYKAGQLPPNLGNALTTSATGIPTGLESWIAQKVTDDDARLFQQSAAGVKISMTNVEASGLPRGATQAAQAEYGKMEVKGGDSALSKAMYFALIKQIANLGVRDLQTSGGTKDQIARAQKSANEINDLIPYTVKDVITASQNSKNISPKQQARLLEQVGGMSSYINTLKQASSNVQQPSGSNPNAHTFNGRIIIPNSNNTGWVYQDTGEVAK
jgi:hypothetical protein